MFLEEEELFYNIGCAIGKKNLETLVCVEGCEMKKREKLIAWLERD